MSSTIRKYGVLRALSFTSAACATLALLAVQCSSPGEQAAKGTTGAVASNAWGVIYGVLQHPRCLNCHPAGDAPLQGDDGHVHAQNVKRGTDGEGLYAMRCQACHQSENLAGAHLPPGAPNWRLPRAEMPLIFEGMSSRELCLQLRDPARNGGKTPEQLLHHMESDPFVHWGWSPGVGRTPVPASHAALVEAVRAWIASDCGCPDR